ncbi:NAD-dependent DNA ligase LigA, partial [Pelagibacteraceae bacterium]|nr:NAD-dependent DNA ligase LigA [Pelagibacteraceae bacterium]
LEVLNQLAEILDIKDVTEDNKNGKLKNKTFMITGKLNGISRAEVKSLIEENAGAVVSSVSKKLNYLIVGEKPTKRKMEAAKNLEIITLDQKQFLTLLNKTS